KCRPCAVLNLGRKPRAWRIPIRAGADGIRGPLLALRSSTNRSDNEENDRGLVHQPSDRIDLSQAGPFHEGLYATDAARRYVLLLDRHRWLRSPPMEIQPYLAGIRTVARQRQPVDDWLRRHVTRAAARRAHQAAATLRTARHATGRLP